MAMETQRTSTRLVKPCTAGPPGLVPLSSADLTMPPLYPHLLYAFAAPAPSTLALEDGLSKVLCEYREWAGRLTHDATSGRPAIELNDEGVLFIEAEALAPLQDLWPFNPSLLLLDHLVPVNNGMPVLLLIQVTQFACGGVILGVAGHHQVGDGVGVMQFMEAWAAMTRGVPMASMPCHDRSMLMGRCRDDAQPMYLNEQMKKVETSALTLNDPEVVARKLNFSVQELKKIKAKGNADVTGGQGGYSTFVSLVAHLWKCITIARGMEVGDEEGSLTRASVAVDVRNRLNPALPKGYFGNAVCHINVQAEVKDVLKEPLSWIARHVHEAIQEVNNDSVHSTFDYVELQRSKQGSGTLMQAPPPNTKGISVISWTAFPLYNLDFGWGTPIFAGNAFVSLDGVLVFLPSYKQDGSIDVALGLRGPHMQKLEAICFA